MAIPSRRKVDTMANTDLRYSTRGKGWNSDPIIHIVDKATLKTLCGKNASDWFILPASIGEYTDLGFICERCKAKKKSLDT